MGAVCNCVSAEQIHRHACPPFLNNKRRTYAHPLTASWAELKPVGEPHCSRTNTTHFGHRGEHESQRPCCGGDSSPSDTDRHSQSIADLRWSAMVWEGAVCQCAAVCRGDASCLALCPLPQQRCGGKPQPSGPGHPHPRRALCC